MASPRHRRAVGARTSRTVVVAVLGALALAACATGPRPSFDADEPMQQATGDPAIDAVLERLDRVGIEQFTADYTILTRLGGLLELPARAFFARTHRPTDPTAAPVRAHPAATWKYAALPWQTSS